MTNEPLPETWLDPRFRWLPMKEAAHRLGCSVNTLIQWRKDGRLSGLGVRSFRVGHRWYFEFRIHV